MNSLNLAEDYSPKKGGGMFHYKHTSKAVFLQIGSADTMYFKKTRRHEDRMGFTAPLLHPKKNIFVGRV
jgi:hypothetical protein